MTKPRREMIRILPRVSIVVPFLVDQNLYYRILTIKLVNQKRNYNGDYRYFGGSYILITSSPT